MTTFTPVLLGGDIGVYAIARSFWEAFHVQSLVLSDSPVAAIRGSQICRIVPIRSSIDPREILEAFQEIEANESSDRFVAMANFDATARAIVELAPRLSQKWVIPFPDLETLDRVSNKSRFYQECEDLGIDVPKTVVVDFTTADDSQWEPPREEIGKISLPVVAKPAASAEYAHVAFPGKKKIFFLEDSQDIEELWDSLKKAGFRGKFLVQELIPGDNTAMRSVTAYVDSRGEVALLASAHVLLEDHLPMMIGNPVAMFTEAYPDLFQAATKYLHHVGYHGFANFDVKVDPRNGRKVFFEVNPRIGRNSYYVTAAGTNPIEVMVRDWVFDDHAPRQEVTNSILYSLVPLRLLLRYVRDPKLASRVRGLIKSHRVFDPTLGPHEKNLRRNFTVRLQKLNQWRKFAKYYPEPTDKSY